MKYLFRIFFGVPFLLSFVLAALFFVYLYIFVLYPVWNFKFMTPLQREATDLINWSAKEPFFTVFIDYIKTGSLK